ncbi:unnamed protein product [Prunus armeniaca]|uniref:Uncharacterized protein n=1 Tax=Prunus armeniaca TaxID=36596 RepID=A0A6J5X4J0_PRUAR|nr:unnamed protein product [Prunus armeniaca]
MSGEELAGPPAPKLLRLLYFVGAGFICTVGINKWQWRASAQVHFTTAAAATTAH